MLNASLMIMVKSTWIVLIVIYASSSRVYLDELEGFVYARRVPKAG